LLCLYQFSEFAKLKEYVLIMRFQFGLQGQLP
jgi:hypothetical protein